jgi:ATP-dependent RNA helicase DHX37/DHR1
VKSILSEIEKNPDSIPSLKPLKIVIMSATLNVEELLLNKQLFPNPVNIINIKTKTFPVNVYYNKESPDDIYEDITRKVCKIHRFLPKGGILIFLPGKQEIMRLLNILEEKLPDVCSREYLKEKNPLKKSEKEKEKKEENKEEEEEEKYDIDDVPEFNPTEMEFEDDSISSLKNIKSMNKKSFVLLPLYSKLDSKHQSKIFKVSDSFRSIVISTNIAETSLTIPGLKYLIDSGLEKTKLIHPSTQATVYKTQYISKASALQRQGRVGRTNIGHCYRVYTPGLYDKMRPFREPEIRRVSLNHLILQLLMVGVKNLFKFPFITQPKSAEMVKSLKGLVEIGALELSEAKANQKNRKNFILTSLGETLSHIPLEPLHAKMILLFRQKGILISGILVVCSLIFENPFDSDKMNKSFEEIHNKEENENKKIKEKHKKFKLMLLDKYQQFINPASDISTRANLLHFLISKILKEFVKLDDNSDKQVKEVKIEEEKFKRLTNNFSLIICNQNSFLNTIISEFCDDYWQVNKIIIESCKFVLQIVKLFLSIETGQEIKTQMLKELINYKKISKKSQNHVSEILIQSIPHKIAFKKTLIIEEKKMTKVFDEDNNEVRIHNSSLIKRNSSFYLYSMKTKIGDKIVLSGLTKILSPSLMLRYCPEYTELKINLKDLSGLLSIYSDSIARIKVNSIFGKGRWESNGMIIEVAEIYRIYEKNQKRIQLLEELRTVENHIQIKPEEESHDKYGNDGLLVTSLQTEEETSR